MKYNPEQKMSDLTVAEYMALQKRSVISLVKWGLLVFYGLPAIIFIIVAIFGLVMTKMAGTS